MVVKQFAQRPPTTYWVWIYLSMASPSSMEVSFIVFLAGSDFWSGYSLRYSSIILANKNFSPFVTDFSKYIQLPSLISRLLSKIIVVWPLSVITKQGMCIRTYCRLPRYTSIRLEKKGERKHQWYLNWKTSFKSITL